MTLLAIDVGAGTQDILLYKEGISPEACPKLVMPSPTVIVAGRIDRARAQRKSLYLYGRTMGGGASVEAVKRHLRAGLEVLATKSAAFTIHDDLELVSSLGVKLVDEEPAHALGIEMGDVDLSSLDQAFSLFGLKLPQCAAIAVQDHGFSPKVSNRVTRFRLMEEAIRQGGALEHFSWKNPPPTFSRMKAVADYLVSRNVEPMLMDTGPAAIFGALQDTRAITPALVLNIGNGHTVAALVQDGAITALFEHHTSSLTPQGLRVLSERLVGGSLTFEEVFRSGGHGVYIRSVPEEVRSVIVTGPRRQHFISALGGIAPVIPAAPGGDMMMAGCLGLVSAWEAFAK